jgi:hypothetical protein
MPLRRSREGFFERKSICCDFENLSAGLIQEKY